MREILLVIHILAVGTWLGANVTQAVVTPKLRAQGGVAAAAWMGSISTMGRVLYTPAAIIILITGFWMVLDSEVYDFEQAFVVIGIATVVIGAVLGMRVFGPKADSAAAEFGSGDDAAGNVVVKSYLPWGVLDTALVVFTIVAMVNRWGA